MSTSKLTEDYIIMNGISHLWQSSDKDSFSASNFAKWSAYAGERSLSSSNSEYRSTTFKSSISHSSFLSARLLPFKCKSILGDPGADSGGEGKSKRAGKYGTKKSKERREEPPGENVLPDQFQTVVAVLASDWCQKTVVFFCPIRSQQTYGSFRVSLHGMIHEWQLLAMFVWAVRGGFARDEKFQSQHKI